MCVSDGFSSVLPYMMLYFYEPSLDAHIAVLMFMPFGTAVPHEIYHGTFHCVFLDSIPNTGEHSLL